MNVIAEIQRINERELELGVPHEASWHQKYRESAWVYVGGLPYELTEGDVICVMSQFGEIEDLNLVRDVKTGKSKGFAFIKYENQKSTVLAVDNMNGARVLERVIRVDHVLKYKLPKEIRDREEAKENAASSDEDEADLVKKRKSIVPIFTGKVHLCESRSMIETARFAGSCLRRQRIGQQIRHSAGSQRVCCT